MKRLLTLLTLCGLAISSLAQTQQGYVKTLGRPNQKGVALSGVTIRVKGAHNTVLSKNDGRFSMQIDGDSYALQQVQKSGYELNEPGVIGRSYAYSANVPLTLVMVSKDQLQNDKQRIENNAYQTAEKNYKAKLALLEKQKEENTITIEQYLQQIQDLQDKFEKYQSLIEGLANHYAHVDYDDLDEKEREINFCIENGELEKAESLLNQLGIQQRIANIEQRLKAGQSLMDEANADMAAVLKQQEKDAEYLYQLYTIALARLDNEKAKQYIDIRAELDTTNSVWQYQAGEFHFFFIADMDAAIAYLKRGLKDADSKSEYESYRWQCYHELGHAYLKKSQFKNALDCLLKALDDDYVYNSDDLTRKALIYTSISTAYHRLGDNNKAFEYIQKTINIGDSISNSKSEQNAVYTYQSIMALYSNMAQISSDLGRYEEASEYYKRAINNAVEKYSKGMLYTNYGVLLRRQKKYDEAMDTFKKALDIDLELYGEHHPTVGRLYGNIGNVYMVTGQLAKAEDYILRSLQNLSRIYGSDHVDIASIYGNLGALCAYQEKWSDGIRYYSKAFEIFSKLYGESNPKTALAYHGIGYCYAKSGNKEKGISYMKKALAIIKQTMGENHYQVKEIEKDISDAQ